jgi:hypothetical protein
MRPCNGRATTSYMMKSPYYGEVPELAGVSATGRMLEECRANLSASRRVAADASRTLAGDPTQVALLLRNSWPLCSETTGALRPKWVNLLVRHAQ